jgi:hypothetical protein
VTNQESKVTSSITRLEALWPTLISITIIEPIKFDIEGISVTNGIEVSVDRFGIGTIIQIPPLAPHTIKYGQQ